MHYFSQKPLQKTRINGGIIEWEWGSDEGTALARSVAWEPTDENSLHLFATKSKKWPMLTVSYGFATTNLFYLVECTYRPMKPKSSDVVIFFSKVLGTAQVFGLTTSRHISLLSFASSSFHRLSEKNEVSNLWPCQFNLVGSSVATMGAAPPHSTQLFWSHPILTVQVHQWDEQKPALQSIDVWLQLTHCATLFIHTV